MDLILNYWPATGNSFRENIVSGSTIADLAAVLPTPDDGYCFQANTIGTSSPLDLQVIKPCEGRGTAIWRPAPSISQSS